MPRIRSPKRGSNSYSPRKRTKHVKGRVHHWPKLKDGPKLVGFSGYKAGMTHLYYVEDRRRVPEYGQEVKSAATIIDTPPILVCALRAYKETYEGIKVISEAWMANQPREFYKRINFTTDADPNKGIKVITDNLDEIVEIRVIIATQPKEASTPQKVPDFMEIPISGGTIEEQLEYAKNLLGKTVSIDDVFEPGESVDVIAVTKGKGFQGPVKRWGIRILSRKSRKQKRAVASIGPWVPRRVMPQVPRAGQMGFHNRTEYNKRIMLMGSDTDRINPKAGFKNYGFVNTEYLLLKGSVMGPAKRLIKLRKSVRITDIPEEPPQVTYLNTEFGKGGEDN